MKTGILALFMLAINISIGQQIRDISISVGFRSHFGGNAAFSDVLNYYNQTRPWLSNEFGTAANLNGFEFGFELNTDKFGFSALHGYRVATKRVASGTDFAGNTFKRTVNYRIHGFELFDFWWTPLHLKGFNFGFGAMPLATGTARIKTTLNGETKKMDLSDLELIEDAFIFRTRHYYANLHVDLTKTAVFGYGDFHLQFFYTIGPKQEYDLYYLNREINPTTFSVINKRTLLRMDNFGLKLNYII